MICQSVGCSDTAQLHKNSRSIHTSVDHEHKPFSDLDVEFRYDNEQTVPCAYDTYEYNQQSGEPGSDDVTNNEIETVHEKRQQESDQEPSPHVIVNILHNDERINNHNENINDDCLIGCGNNQTLIKCKALYHKRCLLKWIATSRKNICLICNRNVSQNLLQQCENQTSSNITSQTQDSMMRRQRITSGGMGTSCIEYILFALLVLLLLVTIFVIYVILA